MDDKNKKQKQRVLNEDTDRKRKESIISTVCIAISITLIASVMIANAMMGNKKEDTGSLLKDEYSLAPAENSAEGVEDEQTQTEETAPESEAVPDASTRDEAPSENVSAAASAAAIDLYSITNPVKSTQSIMDFSYGTSPVYSRTLMEYRSDHSGMDIKASVGEEVKAAFEGTVIFAAEDDRLGTMVIIDHGSGIKTVYANLNGDLSVKKGQSVKAGEVIGKVGKSAAFEIKEGEHLHFAIMKNGEYIDPAEYIK